MSLLLSPRALFRALRAANTPVPVSMPMPAPMSTHDAQAVARACQRLAVSALSAVITACGGGGDGTGSTPVEPPPPAVTSVAVSPNATTLNGVGTGGTVSATIAPSNATGTISWRSDNSAIANVTGNGNSATIRAIAPGTTRIVAAVGSVEGSTQVTVVGIVRALTVPSASLSLNVGATQVVTPALDADPGVSTALNWLSSAPTVATVDNAGSIHALTVGTTTITVSSVANPAISATITVAVGYPPVTLSVSPGTANLLVAGTRQLTATVTAGAGIATTVNWSTSASSVASVSASGMVTANAIGTAIITAASTANPGVSATAQITVAAPAVRSVTLSGPTTALAGDIVQLTGTVDADPGLTTTLIWTTSNAAVATVNQSGRVVTFAPGAVTITARVTGTLVSATQNITISSASFAMRWTETQDGVIDQTPALGAIFSPVMLPDGRTLALTIGNDFAERSAAGVWSVRTSPVSLQMSAIGVSPNGSAWAVGALGTILRYTGNSWVLDAVRGTATLVSISMANDGSGFAVANTGQVYARSSAGVWSTLPALPPTFAYFFVNGISTYTGVTAALGVSETDATGSTATGAYSMLGWNGAAWAIMGTSLPAYKRVGPPTVLPDGSVLASASTNEFYVSIFRGQIGSTTWVQEYIDLTGETAAFGTSITRCADGSYATFLRRGVVLARNGTNWNIALGGPTTGTPLPTSLGCASSTAFVMTNSGRGLVASVVNGASRIERFRADLSRISVGAPNNVLASGNGSGAVLTFDGTTWSAFPVVAESFNTSNSPSVIAWGTNGGMVSSVGLLARRNGNTWSWEQRLTPSAAGASLDGSVIYLTGTESRPPTNNTPSAYGSGLQRLVANTFTDLLPLVQFAEVTTPSLAQDGTLAMRYVSFRRNQWLRIVNGTVIVDSIIGVPSLSQAVAASATWAMLVAENAVVSDGLRMLDTYKWSNGTYTKVPLVTADNTEIITALVARGPSEVYAFTSALRVLGFDGTAWRSLGVTTRRISGAMIRGDFGVAVGAAGTIVYGRVGGASMKLRSR